MGHPVGQGVIDQRPIPAVAPLICSDGVSGVLVHQITNQSFAQGVIGMTLDIVRAVRLVCGRFQKADASLRHVFLDGLMVELHHVGHVSLDRRMVGSSRCGLMCTGKNLGKTSRKSYDPVGHSVIVPAPELRVLIPLGGAQR